MLFIYIRTMLFIQYIFFRVTITRDISHKIKPGPKKTGFDFEVRKTVFLPQTTVREENRPSVCSDIRGWRLQPSFRHPWPG